MAQDPSHRLNHSVVLTQDQTKGVMLKARSDLDIYLVAIKYFYVIYVLQLQTVIEDKQKT